MPARSTRSFLSLTLAAALSLGLVSIAVGQMETASPQPAIDSVAEGAAERAAARDERKAERAAAREGRKAAREERKAERREARAEWRLEYDEHKAERAELRAAWRAVRDDCTAELRAIRANDGSDRAARREAIGDARQRCRELLMAAKAEYRLARRGEASAVDAFYSTAASDGTGVVRTDLGVAEPGSAPGEELGLWHYRIPAGTDLVPHTHPGWQLARITDGELEYTVIEGEAILLRGAESEPMGPGTYILATGDGVIENPELVHRASNHTDGPVTIISATLFPAGAEISTLIGGLEEAPGGATDEATAQAAPAEEASAED